MECKYAYLKHDIEYVLCKKEPEPNRADRKALFHAVCAHQAHCPKQNCHKLTASWLNCAKLTEKAQPAAEAEFAESVPVETVTPNKAARSRRKPQSED